MHALCRVGTGEARDNKPVIAEATDRAGSQHPNSPGDHDGGLCGQTAAPCHHRRHCIEIQRPAPKVPRVDGHRAAAVVSANMNNYVSAIRQTRNLTVCKALVPAVDGHGVCWARFPQQAARQQRNRPVAQRSRVNQEGLRQCARHCGRRSRPDARENRRHDRRRKAGPDGLADLAVGTEGEHAHLAVVQLTVAVAADVSDFRLRKKRRAGAAPREG